jgi:outer membrane protein TolC
LKASPVDAYPEDGLNPEAPLEAWLGVKDTPADKLAPKALEVAEAGRKASNYALLPVLSANAQERFTNATGFAGKVASYAIQGVLSWKLDYGTYATPDVQQRAIELQQLRTERTRRELEDAIFEAYQRVQSGIVKSTAARAQVAAANQAASLALDRYQAGAATQIDVTQNQRDAFSASAAQIQADADLAYARALLRINAGRPVTSSGSSGPAPAPPSK